MRNLRVHIVPGAALVIQSGRNGNILDPLGTRSRTQSPEHRGYGIILAEVSFPYPLRIRSSHLSTERRRHRTEDLQRGDSGRR